MSDNEDLIEFLKIHSCTRNLHLDEIAEIANFSVLREYQPGEKALVNGQPANAISLIISGLFTMSTTDDVHTGFGFLGPNDQIGTLAIVQDSVSPTNVIANEPSLVIELSSAVAQDLMSKNRVFARNLLGNRVMRKSPSRNR